MTNILDLYFSTGFSTLTQKADLTARTLLKGEQGQNIMSGINQGLDISLAAFQGIRNLTKPNAEVVSDIVSLNRQTDLRREPDQIRPTIVLYDVDIIDAANVPWQAIIELRQDKASLTKLRRFRSFLTSSMCGLSKEEVADKLQLALQDYKDTAESYGLHLKRGQIKTVLSWKAFSAIGVVGLLAGEPLTWATFGTASAGYLLELIHGKLALEKQAQDWNLTLSRDPIVHLIELENLGALRKLE